MNVVLISTYELGHQPFGLASPAAWLARAGAHVTCLDLAVQQFDPDLLEDAVEAITDADADVIDGSQTQGQQPDDTL